MPDQRLDAADLPYVQKHECLPLPPEMPNALAKPITLQLFQWRACGLCSRGRQRAAVNGRQILFPAAYVLSGDTIDTGQFFFVADDDKDDYSQNCVGGAVNGNSVVEWQAHDKGQDILVPDGHVKWYKEYNPGEMTFRYDSITLAVIAQTVSKPLDAYHACHRR